MSWMPCGGREGRAEVIAAEVMFDALVVDEGAVQRNQLRLHPPTIIDFFSDRLVPV